MKLRQEPLFCDVCAENSEFFIRISSNWPLDGFNRALSPNERAARGGYNLPQRFLTGA